MPKQGGAAVFLAFPISGGSLNPARTLGPDIVSASFPSWWIYLLGPLAGAAFSGWIWQYLKRGRQPGEDEPTATDASRPGAGGQPARPRTGKFVVSKDAGGKYHFTLVASNGQVIATSEAYERRQAALHGIEAVKKNAPDADITSQDGEWTSGTAHRTLLVAAPLTCAHPGSDGDGSRPSTPGRPAAIDIALADPIVQRLGAHPRRPETALIPPGIG